MRNIVNGMKKADGTRSRLYIKTRKTIVPDEILTEMLTEVTFVQNIYYKLSGKLYAL